MEACCCQTDVCLSVRLKQKEEADRKSICQ